MQRSVAWTQAELFGSAEHLHDPRHIEKLVIAIEDDEEVGCNQQRLKRYRRLVAHCLSAPHAPDHPNNEDDCVEDEELGDERWLTPEQKLPGKDVLAAFEELLHNFTPFSQLGLACVLSPVRG